MPAPKSIDWSAVRDRAAAILADYIRIDTTNPPGNEAAAVHFLAGHLERAGIAHEVLGAEPGRPNLIARLKGDGSARPLILLSHTDVVAADPKEWVVAPFAGEIRDGHLWGRGALDCKSLGVMHLMALLLLKEQGRALKRDVLFVAVADEEQGGALGAGFLTEKHPDKVQAEFLLGEGGFGLVVGKNPGVWLPCYAEKGILWLKLTSRGAGGHSSMPRSDSAVLRMIRALSKVQRMESPVFITREAEENIKSLSAKVKFPLSVLFRRPRSWLSTFAIKRAVLKNDMARVLMFSTLAVTGLKAGSGENQIPSSCEATLDCRIHPADSSAAFLGRVRAALRPEGVECAVLLDSPPSRSPVDTEFFRALDQVLPRHSPAKVVVPALFPGTTDARFFRRLGICCYGLSPLLVSLEDLEVHGKDERVGLDNLGMGCRSFYELLSEFCGK